MNRVRHTNVPLEVLIGDVRALQGLTTICRHVCHCFVVDEIGVMAHEGNNEAETFLCEVLCHSVMKLRVMSYIYLKTLPKPQEQTKKALIEFETNPENTNLVKLAMEVIQDEGKEPLSRSRALNIS